MARFNGFTKKQLANVFTQMVTARELDLKMLILLKQGKSFFHMGCSRGNMERPLMLSSSPPNFDVIPMENSFLG